MKISLALVITLTTLAVTNASTKAGVDFYETEDIYTNTALVHGALEFKLDPVKSMMNNVDSILSRFLGRPEYTSMVDILKPQVQKMINLFSEVQLLTYDVAKAQGRPSSDVSPYPSRKKRFVAALASVLGLGIGSLLGYEFNNLLESGNSQEVNSRLDNMEYCINNAISKEEIIGKELEVNRKAINDIYKKLNDTAKILNDFFIHVIDLVRLNQISNNIIELLNDYKEILISALQNKISQKLLTHTQIGQLVSNIKKIVPPGYKLVTENFSQIMALGASASIEENRFFLVIHFPVYKVGSHFKSFLVRQRPFIAGDHFLSFNSPNDVIAISPQNDYYFETKKLDLEEQCTKVLGKYFCNHITQWDSNFDASCLYQLYQNNQESARNLCKLVTIPKKETVIEITSGLLKWFYPISTTVQMKCPGKSLPIPVELSSDNTFQFSKKQMKMNCVILSGSKRIRPTHQLNLPAQVVTYSYEIKEYLFEEKMNSLAHVVPTNNVSYDVDTLKNLQHIPRVQHTIIGSAFGFSAFSIVMLSGFCFAAYKIYKHCKKNKKQQADDANQIERKFEVQTSQTIVHNHLPHVNFHAKSGSIAIPIPSAQNVYSEPEHVEPLPPIVHDANV